MLISYNEFKCLNRLRGFSFFVPIQHNQILNFILNVRYLDVHINILIIIIINTFINCYILYSISLNNVVHVL